MYHIKRDKRSQRSAENILLTFQRLLDSKPLSNISASDISREAEVSRSTFYRLFDTPEDVLLYWCLTYEDSVKQHFSNVHFHNLHDFFQYSVRFFDEHSHLPEILISNHRQDLMQRLYFRRIDFLKESDFILQISEPDKREYFTALIFNALYTIFTVWLRRGKKENIETLFDYLMDYCTSISNTVRNDLL